MNRALFQMAASRLRFSVTYISFLFLVMLMYSSICRLYLTWRTPTRNWEVTWRICSLTLPSKSMLLAIVLAYSLYSYRFIQTRNTEKRISRHLIELLLLRRSHCICRYHVIVSWLSVHTKTLPHKSHIPIRQIDVSGSRKAVIIHLPFRLRKAFRKIHARLVRELEKKFSGKVSECTQHHE
jgi:hypothetical protein